MISYNFIKRVSILCFLFCMGIAYAYQGEWLLFEKSANRGDATAQYNLGLMYYEGTNGVKDDVQAYKWFALSAQNADFDFYRNQTIEHLLNLLEIVMTPVQISEAQRLASQFEVQE